jgi:glycosyltransferase involved in cell wall biosynthesis
VPAFREEEALPGTLKELRAVVPEVDVLVVDDGSPDATAGAARAERATVVRLPFNLGVGAAVRAGLHYAKDHDYARAVVLDADGQHDPEGVRALLGALDAGADVAVGSRFAPESGAYPVSRIRRRAMRNLARTVRRITGQPLTDVTSGFRAFDRAAIELLAREYPAEFLADTVEVLLVAHYAGLRIAEVPITMRPRAAGQPSNRHVNLIVSFLRLRIGIASAAYRRGRPHDRESRA